MNNLKAGVMLLAAGVGAGISGGIVGHDVGLEEGMTRWRVKAPMPRSRLRAHDHVMQEIEFEYKTVLNAVAGHDELCPVGVAGVTLYHDFPPYGSLDLVERSKRVSSGLPWPVPDCFDPSDPEFKEFQKKYDGE